MNIIQNFSILKSIRILLKNKLHLHVQYSFEPLGKERLIHVTILLYESKFINKIKFQSNE